MKGILGVLGTCWLVQANPGRPIRSLHYFVMFYWLLFTCPTTHLSDNPLVRQNCESSALVRQPSCPTTCSTTHLSDNSFIRHLTCPTTHLSDNSFVRHLTCPTAHLSDNVLTYVSLVRQCFNVSLVRQCFNICLTCLTLF